MQRLLIFLGCFLSLDALCKIIALIAGPNSFMVSHNWLMLLIAFVLATPLAIYMIRVNEKNGKKERKELQSFSEKMSLGCWGALAGFALTIIISYYTLNALWVAILGSLIVGGEMVFSKENLNKYNEALNNLPTNNVLPDTPLQNTLTNNELQTNQTQNAMQTYSKLVLLSQGKYEALSEEVSKTYLLLDTICSEKEFRNYMSGINKGADSLAAKEDLMFGMKCFFAKDVIYIFEKLGHLVNNYNPATGEKPCIIDLDIKEGQYLYEFASIMLNINTGKEDVPTYENFKDEILGTTSFHESLRETRQKTIQTLANADVSAKASDGHEDFQACLAIHGYSKEYEQLYRIMMHRIASVVAKVDDMVTVEESKWLSTILEDEQDEAVTPQQETIVPLTIDRLDEMIGLETVKTSIHSLSNFIYMMKKRQESGMKSPSISYHCVFTGNPGTGKTTVARILAGVYKDLGVLRKGHLVETDRSGLVAEYVGQTAVKTNKIIDKALDGVLFIDEAYALAQGGNEDYGKEAIATLLKRMEDIRDRLVVILAGYTDEIEQFINSNPGLRSRFNRYIGFPDYSAEELLEIFQLQTRKNDYTLAEEADDCLKKHFASKIAQKTKDFGNARYVRNLFEKTIEMQANRLASVPQLTKEMMETIILSDVQQAMSAVG